MSYHRCKGGNLGTSELIRKGKLSCDLNLWEEAFLEKIIPLHSF